MEEPKPLESIFKEKIFRIPDYQRGYAWNQDDTRNPLRDFWEDLINLSDNRSHYTGVLTLREITEQIKENEPEYWLIEDHSYKMYHIVDGQQRLTTFIIMLQALIELIGGLDENSNKKLEEIYLTDTLKLSEINDKFLFKLKPGKKLYRSYKFGYTVDNPSYQYLRYKIFNEEGSGTIQETFYTLNLRNAKAYFKAQLLALYNSEGLDSLNQLYKKLTKKFLFNEYIIKDEFDVFVAFETMNNRGKKLSDLELLKNRLIYLTTLYPDSEIETAERASLRENINEAWKEVYHQLGRNDKKPLNDDDFLKAHWIMYFKYSREKGNDYIRFLLDDQFTPKNIHAKKEVEVELELPEEQKTDFDIDSNDDENNDIKVVKMISKLSPNEIKDYVLSLKSSARHWFNTFYPEKSSKLTEGEKELIDRLNRIGMGYFRPLVMSVLKNIKKESDRKKIFQKIERFIFVAFHLNRANRNYGDSEFYNAARELNEGKLTADEITQKITNRENFAFDENGKLKVDTLRLFLSKKFNEGQKLGYYAWKALRYFLYEYEMDLFNDSRQQKVFWTDLIKSEYDSISIEHILPQTPTKYWKKRFDDLTPKKLQRYGNSLGNLLLLSKSINSSLQNDTFEEKKDPKIDPKTKIKLRNGYSDGSHSEIEVSQYDEWNSETIKERGLRLLNFMEKRWDIKFSNNSVKEELLFLDD